MEQFTLECIREQALRSGFTTLIGEYLPTAKNGLVRDHYTRLGFTDIGSGWWELNLEQPIATQNFIKAI
jgi:predicted enzyme involved in methoxymalonyl-ACP biosynthesis